jgi:prepilin-type N-terminal cleavage/methylation domain-containing protein
MTLPTGMNRSDNPIRRPCEWRGQSPCAARAFTLIEFILVMALLATLMAIAVPSLSRSMRQRSLDQEAVRFLALTEHARNEAISHGVPMEIWIDTDASRFGLRSKPGHLLIEPRQVEYQLGPETRFELESRLGLFGIQRIEFGPDGALAWDSLDVLRLVDRQRAEVLIARGTRGYEIVKPREDARLRR